MRSLSREVKNRDWFPRSPRENHGSGLRYVSRPMRTVDGERHMLPFFQPAGHDGQAFNGSARRASLSCAEPKPLDHPPGPLPVEIHRVEHHDSTFSPNPDRGENAAVPKCADRDFARVSNLHRILHPDHFHS